MHFYKLIASRLPKTVQTAKQTLLAFSTMANKTHQNVVVMRHGDRIDNFEPDWVKTSPRPWDPPLFEQGLLRAFSTGAKLRSDLGFPIHRVFVSPFIRCVQTAAQAVTALASIETPTSEKYGQPAPVDPSKLKVSIEYGLCEMLNKQAIRENVNPKDGNWGFDIAELEAKFPEGMVDRTVEKVYTELPLWGESVMEARSRYASVFQALADKYPTENLLLVTHGEGVATSVAEFLEGATVYQVEYCAYSKLQRPIFGSDQSSTAGKFEVLTKTGETGINYSLTLLEQPVYISLLSSSADGKTTRRLFISIADLIGSSLLDSSLMLSFFSLFGIFMCGSSP